MLSKLYILQQMPTHRHPEALHLSLIMLNSSKRNKQMKEKKKKENKQSNVFMEKKYKARFYMNKNSC